MPKWEAPTPTSLKTLKTCSPQLPEELLLFYKTLLRGIREPQGDDNREAVARKVTFMSSDAVYNTSKGAVRPWKHTVLGLGVASLTGSNLMMQILNRLGNTLSYDEIKALETEFAYSVNSDTDVPDGVEKEPTFGKGLAWDNYDDITGMLEILKSAYDDHTIGMKAAISLCMGGNDFIPKYYQVTHDRVAKEIFSRNHFLENLFEFQDDHVGINEDGHTDLIKCIYCPKTMAKKSDPLALPLNTIQSATVESKSHKVRHPQQ